VAPARRQLHLDLHPAVDDRLGVLEAQPRPAAAEQPEVRLVEALLDLAQAASIALLGSAVEVGDQVLEVRRGAQKLRRLAVEERQALAVLLVLLDRQQVDVAQLRQRLAEARLLLAQLAAAGLAGVELGARRGRGDRRIAEQLAQAQPQPSAPPATR
jgi:hypothetical protein